MTLSTERNVTGLQVLISVDTEPMGSSGEVDFRKNNAILIPEVDREIFIKY